MENFQKYRALLTQNHNFRKLFAARLITLGGDWLLTVPLLGIIYELTENPFITSLVLVVQSAPLFMLGSFGGYLADSCLLYTSPSPRDGCRSRMPSSA